MELQYFGANCVRITTKKASIVTDDNLEQLGLKPVTKAEDISLRTNRDIAKPKAARFTAEAPGEYEISGVVIKGVAARAHTEEAGKHGATIYTVVAEDIKLAVLGHIYPELSEEQLEAIGLVDVVVVPVGGNGYTLDGVGALNIIKKIEPKMVIPTHYADKAIRYEVAQQELAEAVKGLGMEISQTVDKLKVKLADLSDTAQLVVLERQ